MSLLNGLKTTWAQRTSISSQFWKGIMIMKKWLNMCVCGSLGSTDNAATNGSQRSSCEASSVGMVHPAALPSARAQLQGRGAGHAAYESTRGAWYRLTSDDRGTSAQRMLGLVGRVCQPQRCLKMSDIPSLLELWKSRFRVYGKLVFQTEKTQTKVPDTYKVLTVRSSVLKLGQLITQNPSNSEPEDHQRVYH